MSERVEAGLLDRNRNGLWSAGAERVSERRPRFGCARTGLLHPCLRPVRKPKRRRHFVLPPHSIWRSIVRSQAHVGCYSGREYSPASLRSRDIALAQEVEWRNHIGNSRTAS